MPVRTVSVQLALPLHARVTHALLVHVTGRPPQVPAPQLSECVHALPSSQPGAARHAQLPPLLVQKYVVPPHATCWQSE